MKSIIKILSVTIIASSIVGVAFGQQTTTRKQFCDSDKLRILVLDGKIDSVKMCLSQKADPNLPNEDGLTLLMIAAAKGHDVIVKELINKSANINAKTNRDSITALMFAANFLHFSTVKILVDKGHADVTIKDKSDNRNAIDWAILANSNSEISLSNPQTDSITISISKYLVSKGAIFKDPKAQSGVDLLMGFGTAPNISLLLHKLHKNN